MKPYCRPFDNSRLVEHFVKNVLEITETKECRKAINKIIDAELQNSSLNEKTTLLHDDFRDLDYKTEISRKGLRKRIFEELIENERLDDDDKIKLGLGGAIPHGKKIQDKKQAFLVIGLPASGKSVVTSMISDNYGAVILDSDFAKRKLPEYRTTYIGASLVHDESNRIVFGSIDDECNMLEYCCNLNFNIVIPKIGHNIDEILEFTDTLKKDFGYDVHLTLVSLDRKKATKRAYFRFVKSKRYVPLSLIFDWYSNEPILTYYRIRNHNNFTSYGKISTDVPIGDPYIFIEASDGNPALLFKK